MYAGVTIGLESTELIISEDDGNITICTTIEDGVLGRQVEVSYSTEDGSAAGTYMCPKIALEAPTTAFHGSY